MKVDTIIILQAHIYRLFSTKDRPYYAIICTFFPLTVSWKFFISRPAKLSERHLMAVQVLL